MKNAGSGRWTGEALTLRVLAAGPCCVFDEDGEGPVKI